MIEVFRLDEHRLAMFLLALCLVCQSLNSCFSLNVEGVALLSFRERVDDDPFGALSNWNYDVVAVDHCLWFGVVCLDGKVVTLSLNSLCLRGTISPDLGNLVHVKSINLRNNSFYGTIPETIRKLKELEVLDLGYNNFSGPLPIDLGKNLSPTLLLINNNPLLGSVSPEVRAEAQVAENQLSNPERRWSWNTRSFSWDSLRETKGVFSRYISQAGNFARRKLRKTTNFKLVTLSPSPSPSPSRSPSPTPAKTARELSPLPEASLSSPSPSFAIPQQISPHLPLRNAKKSSGNSSFVIVSAVLGGSAVLVVIAAGIYCCQSNKVATVRPWATGLSGQLQKAFITGVPKLKRSELESACEDFSNVIGTSSIGTIYKGTLSSGVEIAVASVAFDFAKGWSKNMEAQFRKKIDTLSKVNHKNFVNLLGYCEEEEPFTRMIVFEYAPNGTLFEHLHIREAEHLDWATRIRIAMGVAYCLEFLHQLTPPIPHRNLTSSSISLTEDYAAKISDISFSADPSSSSDESTPEGNVYSFGVLLFEMVTGRLPYSVGSDSVDNWATDYLTGDRSIGEMVDPTLRNSDFNELGEIGGVIRWCGLPDPRRRPRMSEVTARMREITRITPDGAIPKISPLWWAELEIVSTEAD